MGGLIAFEEFAEAASLFDSTELSDADRTRYQFSSSTPLKSNVVPSLREIVPEASFESVATPSL